MSLQFAGTVQSLSTPVATEAAAAVFLIVAVGCGVWAFAERNRAITQCARLRATLRQMQAAIRFRDRVMHALPDSIVILPVSNRKMLSYQGGGRLLKYCLAGPDARRLATAIENLLAYGDVFALQVRTGMMTSIAAHGRLVDDAAIIFLQPQQQASVRKPVLSVPRALPAPRTSPVCDAVPIESGTRRTSDRDGAIIVGADGRLIQYNEAFMDLWSLTEKELRDEPGIAQIARLCTARKGRDAIWDIIASANASNEPERHADWGTQTRADGRRIALSIVRLQDGNTFVEFVEDGARAV